MDDSSTIRRDHFQAARNDRSMQFDFDYSILPHSIEMLRYKSTIVFAMHSTNFNRFVLSVLLKEATMIHSS